MSYLFARLFTFNRQGTLSMQKSNWVTLLAAACISAASTAAFAATPTTGTWEIDGTFTGATRLFSTFHMQSFLEFSDNGSLLNHDMQELDLDGDSWLGRGTSTIENLSGNLRYRMTFRDQSMPDGSTKTFELFVRFLPSNETRVTNNVVTILSSSTSSTSFTSTPTWDPGPITSPIPEPGTMAMMGLGIAAIAAVRRRTSNRPAPAIAA